MPARSVRKMTAADLRSLRPALGRPCSGADLHNALAETASSLSLVSFAYLFPSLQIGRVTDLISTYPQPRTSHCLHSRYEDVDPVIHQARLRRETFRWVLTEPIWTCRRHSGSRSMRRPNSAFAVVLLRRVIDGSGGALQAFPTANKTPLPIPGGTGTTVMLNTIGARRLLSLPACRWRATSCAVSSLSHHAMASLRSGR
jgi:hypothetical protein